MALIFPTVGRKVWFYPSSVDTMTRREQPLDATIVYVWSDRLVNLVVFDANGCMYARSSVRLVQDIDRKPKEGLAYCEWMPYQKGQAAKTELVEEAAKRAVVKDVAVTVATEAVKEAVLNPTPLDPKGDGSNIGPDGA